MVIGLGECCVSQKTVAQAMVTDETPFSILFPSTAINNGCV